MFESRYQYMVMGDDSFIKGYDRRTIELSNAASHTKLDTNSIK